MNPNYRIRYRKKDFELEVEGDQEFVLRQFSNLIDLDINKTSMLEAAGLSGSPDHGDSVTLVEFYKLKRPNTHDERFVLFAYWYVVKEGNESFKVDDIVSFYAKVSERKPNNPAQHMTNNVKRAYFQRVEDGLYKLTKSGIQFVLSITNNGD